MALLRRAPTGDTAPASAVAVALLNALRALSDHDRLLVALDDVQWLDEASAAALAFAARRLAGDCAALPRTAPGERDPARAGARAQGHTASGARRAEPRRDPPSPAGTARAQPLTSGDAAYLRHDARQSAVRTRGRTDARRGRRAVDRRRASRALSGSRSCSGRGSQPLPDAPRAVLTMVALSPDLRLGQLTALGGEGALAAAVEAGVLVVDGDHVCVAPARSPRPLLGSTRLPSVVGCTDASPRSSRTVSFALVTWRSRPRSPTPRSPRRSPRRLRLRDEAVLRLRRARGSRPPAHAARRPGPASIGCWSSAATSRCGEKQRLSDLLARCRLARAVPRAPAPGSCSPAAPSRATARSSTSSSARWQRARTIRGCGRRCWASSPPTWLPSVSSGSG